MMTELFKEINQAKAYLRAMKKTGHHKGDCDNVIMHLDNIEMLVNKNDLSHGVSGSYYYYYLKDGDTIKATDEFITDHGIWMKTGMDGQIYNESDYYQHRRLI